MCLLEEVFYDIKANTYMRCEVNDDALIPSTIMFMLPNGNRVYPDELCKMSEVPEEDQDSALAMWELAHE